jgi:sugar-specific transcriptional regulator TrmB
VSDALRTFETFEDEMFRLQMPRDEAVVLAEDARDLLHDAAEVYQKRYKIALEIPVLVQIFDDHDEFIVRSVGLPGVPDTWGSASAS